ncbi:MAG: hypothetical protein B7Z57_08320 [Acidiphilium sp. 37-60-79]|nr:MAG: hypothetical protein B7Z57_08320 [Acidiphilium sp. 37-60-79]
MQCLKEELSIIALRSLVQNSDGSLQKTACVTIVARLKCDYAAGDPTLCAIWITADCLYIGIIRGAQLTRVAQDLS